MATALIQERGTVSGNQPRMQRLIEDASQTFLSGTPLQINTANGALKAWDGTTVAAGIAGIGKEFGANLTTAGVAQQQTFQQVQNEPNAANFSRPYFNDGKTGIVVANLDTVFYGQVGPSQTTAASDVGISYGLTKDSDNHWYVDKTKTGSSAVVKVIGLDQWDTARGVQFQFLAAAMQLQA
jgi:hypothetical protein